MATCKHPTCGESCRRPVKPKKRYYLKRTAIKKKKPVLKKDLSVLSVTELMQLAKMVFNKWIRHRDGNKPCISSGGEVEEAGHYFPSGTFSGVRFDEVNVNGQSKYDNCFKEGNLPDYRSGLIDRYGLPVLIELEERAANTKFKKWDRSELSDIIKKYTL
jgi:hypothetical protein